MTKDSTLRQVLEGFEALLSSGSRPQGMTLSFAIVDLGTSLTIDTSHERLFTYEWRKSADIAVVTNSTTLLDFLGGAFEPTAPKAEHLFVWDAIPGAWRKLADALFGGASPLATRMRALNAS